MAQSQPPGELPSTAGCRRADPPAKKPMTTTLICDCNKTMPLEPKTLGTALAEKLPLHSALCRREAGAFQQAIRSGDDVVVACTQEKRLFGELAAADAGRDVADPLRQHPRDRRLEPRREQRDAQDRGPAGGRATCPSRSRCRPSATRSQGRLLVIGPLDEAEQAAALVADALDVTIFSRGAGAQGGAQERRWPVMAGRIESLAGWLGAFTLDWTRDNPIDLDLCTRCNACVAACPEQAIGLDYQIDMARLHRPPRLRARLRPSAGAIDFSARAGARSTAPSTWCSTCGAAPLIDWHAPPQGYFHLPRRHRQAQGLADAAASCATWSANSRSPSSSTTSRSSARTAATKQVGCNACIEVCSAARDHAATRRASGSWSTPTCASAAAPAPPCARPARWPTPIRARAEQGTKLRTLLATYAAGRRHATPCCCCTARKAARRWSSSWAAQAQLGAAQGVPAQRDAARRCGTPPAPASTCG